MNNVPQNVSQAVRRLNPHLYGVVGGLDRTKPESTVAQTLVGRKQEQQSISSGVAIRVSFIRCGRKRLDTDNLSGCMKPLRDAIAESFGRDDGDAGIEWEYGQHVSAGKPGVIVKIEL